MDEDECLLACLLAWLLGRLGYATGRTKGLSVVVVCENLVRCV